MATQKTGSRRSFSAAVHNTQSIKKTPRPVAKIIREDQPVPRPKPPAMGQVIDAQNFDQRWQHQLNASKQPDPFDVIDAKQKTLNAEFTKNKQKYTLVFSVPISSVVFPKTTCFRFYSPPIVEHEKET